MKSKTKTQTKMKYSLLLLLLSLTLQCPAQLLKKIKKATKEKVEQKIVKKSSDKATEVVDKKMDQALDKISIDPENIQLGGIGLGSIEDLPDKYQTSWLYALEIEDNKGDKSTLIYHIEPQSQFIINKLPDMEAYSVMDFERQLMVMFLEEKGQKQVQVVKYDFNKHQKQENIDPDDMERMNNLKSIGSKSIMNYHCEGFELEDEKGISRIYITEETPLRFANLFRSNLPIFNGVENKNFQKIADGLVMEMSYQSKKKKKENFVARCTDLQEKDKIFIIDDYVALGQ